MRGEKQVTSRRERRRKGHEGRITMEEQEGRIRRGDKQGGNRNGEYLERNREKQRGE